MSSIAELTSISKPGLLSYHLIFFSIIDTNLRLEKQGDNSVNYPKKYKRMLHLTKIFRKYETLQDPCF